MSLGGLVEGSKHLRGLHSSFLDSRSLGRSARASVEYGLRTVALRPFSRTNLEKLMPHHTSVEDVKRILMVTICKLRTAKRKSKSGIHEDVIEQTISTAHDFIENELRHLDERSIDEHRQRTKIRYKIHEAIKDDKTDSIMTLLATLQLIRAIDNAEFYVRQLNCQDSANGELNSYYQSFQEAIGLVLRTLNDSGD